MNDIKDWIKENLRYSRGLICKKCKLEWFVKYNVIDKWNEIHNLTAFLDPISPTFPQRVWHIINKTPSLVTCANPDCKHVPKFWSFNEGYWRTCSLSCAQYDPITKSKIQQTNIKKYNSKYGLQNLDVIAKRHATLMEKYGVENISQVAGISEKKQETCMKNYGTKWFLERTDLVKEHINEIYGVDNVQQVSEISNQAAKTKMDGFYDSLSTTDRFNGKVEIAFTKDEYTGTCREYKFKCKLCNIIFNYDFRWGRIPRCPTCYKNSSVFEKEITDYIKSILPLNTTIEENTKSILSNNYELDIYIPSKKLAIECNGLFWHGELGGNKGKNYHLNKTIECEDKGIHLIHIFEDEWILSSEIVKNKLLHILNENKKNTIYARKCKIQEISSLEKNMFLDKYHIQGADKSKIHIGLYYEKELVSVVTFGMRRIFTHTTANPGEYELIRFATSRTVVGAAGKLLAYFIKTYSPTKIISYADRRWTYGKSNVYEKIGFTKISDGTPNYWYFGRDGNYRRFHRFGFAKHTLPKRLASFDPMLTEWDNMKLNGWDRIWDCGSLLYEMSI